MNLDKTKEEIKDDEEYAERLLRCVGCENQGGIKTPKRELPLKFWNDEIQKKDFSRLDKHLAALREGNDNE